MDSGAACAKARSETNAALSAAAPTATTIAALDPRFLFCVISSSTFNVYLARPAGFEGAVALPRLPPPVPGSDTEKLSSTNDLIVSFSTLGALNTP